MSLSSDAVIKQLSSNTWPLFHHGLETDILIFTLLILAGEDPIVFLAVSVLSGSIFGMGSEQFNGVSLCGRNSVSNY